MTLKLLKGIVQRFLGNFPVEMDEKANLKVIIV